MTSVYLFTSLLLSKSEFLGIDTIANLFGVTHTFCLYNKKGHSNHTVGVLGFVNPLTPALWTIVVETSPDLD